MSLRAENRRYPATVTPVSASRLQELQAELDSLKTTHIRADINQYGLISSKNSMVGGPSSITDTGLLVSKAREAFVRFSKFTNVTDTSQLTDLEVTRFTIPGHETWVVAFYHQYHDGIEVENTECYASIDSGVCAIAGHHYRDIFIPVRDTISRTRAAQSLTGYTIPYECWGPDTLIVRSELVLRDEIRRLVLPMEVNGTIELRVAWEIPIAGAPAAGTDWLFYVDILTGEILRIDQLFIC